MTGQYQYSTQFGIKAGACNAAPKPSSAPAPSATPEAAKPSTPAGGYAMNTPVPQSTPGYAAQPPYPTTVATSTSSCPPTAAGTGAPHTNGTVPGGAASPSGTGNSTHPHLPEVSTSGAANLKATLSLVGAAAVAMAFML